MKFENYIPDVKKTIQQKMKAALHAIGEYVTGEAVDRSPVMTGNLQGSITYRVEKDHVDIGTPVDYAVYVELGTRRMTAKPYLRPAVEENIRTIEKLTKEYMK